MKLFILGAALGFGAYRLSKTKYVRRRARNFARTVTLPFAEEIVRHLTNNGMTEEEMATVTDILERRMKRQAN